MVLRGKRFIAFDSEVFANNACSQASHALRHPAKTTQRSQCIKAKRPSACGLYSHLTRFMTCRQSSHSPYSTVTDLAKLRGLSTSVPRATAV